MPLYQLLCISAHYTDYSLIKNLITHSSNHIMASGGVVRNIAFRGTQTLPQRMKRHGTIRSTGDYWSLHFDTSPRTLRSLNTLLRRDPLVIRWTMLKLAEKAQDYSS